MQPRDAGSDPKALAAQIRNTTSEIEQLAMRVYDKLDIPDGDSKRVPFYFSQPASFMLPDMTQRETTFVNGGQDVSILALTYAVATSQRDSGDTAITFGGATQPAHVTPYQNALTVLNSAFVLASPRTTGALFRLLFDFEWNFRTKTGKPYLSGGSVGAGSGNSFMTPRTAMGFPEQGEFLRFSRPQVVKAGESLVFAVKPTMWARDGAANGIAALLADGTYIPTRAIVNIIGIGFRDGRMAWPTVRK